MQRILVIDDEAHIRHMMRITRPLAMRSAKQQTVCEAWRCVALTRLGRRVAGPEDAGYRWH